MATTYLSRTATSGNNTTGTFSAWIKRGNLSSTQCPIGVAVDGNNFINIQFNSSNQLNLRWYDDGSPDANYNKKLNEKYLNKNTFRFLLNQQDKILVLLFSLCKTEGGESQTPYEINSF